MTQLEKDFLAWYFSGSDQEQHYTIFSIGKLIVEQLEESGNAKLSVGDLMNESLDVYLEENKQP